jgi:hypothetical protein
VPSGCCVRVVLPRAVVSSRDVSNERPVQDVAPS